MTKTQGRDPLEIIFIGVLMLLVPLTGMLSTIFPPPPSCIITDIGSFLNFIPCTLSAAAAYTAIGTLSGLVAAGFTFGGLILIFYGIYKYVKG